MANRPDAVNKPNAGTSQHGPTVLLIALAIAAQTVWLYWVFSIPLPNAGAGISRGYILWRFLPEVVPDFPYRDTFLAATLRIFSTPRYFSQRVPVILAAGLILVSALAVGRLVTRGLRLTDVLSRAERFGLAYGLGMSGLAWITLTVGRLGLLSPLTTRVGLLVPIVVEAILTWRKHGQVNSETKSGLPPLWSGSIPTLMLVVLPFLTAMALGSMLPTIDFDAIEYHVQGPKEYFLAGRIGFLPHNVYTSMPFSVEMLHLLGMELWNDWWWGALVGQLLNASFAPAAGWMIWLTVRRWGTPRAAWFATVLYLSTPWIYRLAAIPYVEGPLCYYHAALIWATGRAWSGAEPTRTRLWALAGLLAGGAMGIKYPALVSAVIPFGLAAAVAGVRDRSIRGVAAYSLAVALVMAPWLAKNVIDTGNPVYPLGYKVFGGRHWDEAMDAKWAAAHGPRPIQAGAFVNSVLDVAGRSDWQSPALTMLAPFAFLIPARRRLVLPVAGFVAYIFLTWWFLTHRLDRFWIPLMPGLAILAGVGVEWSRRRLWSAFVYSAVAVVLLTNFLYCATPMCGLNDWLADLRRLRSDVPRMLNPALSGMDEFLPRDAKPLLVAQAAVFHLKRPVVYNTVFNKETIEEISKDRSPEEFRAKLKEMGITHVYVDWAEIQRYTSPGNYGFTDYVTRERLAGWVSAGVLGPPREIGQAQQLYEVP